MIGAYFKRVFVVLDILLNVLRGGDKETISSACGKKLLQREPCRLCARICALLDKRWPGHCLGNIREPYQ